MLQSTLKAFRFTKNAPQFSKSFSTVAPFGDVVIVSAVRTPIGSFMGKLKDVPAAKLGAIAVREAVKRAGIDGKEVNEVILGNVLSAGMGQAPARQAAIGAGLPDNVVCTTVNKVCSSGMKTVMYGAQSIMLGLHDVVVAGGFESMSNVPYYLDKARSGYKYGHGQLLDGVLKDGLVDAFNEIHMGDCAEQCALKYGFTREDQDQYAIMAYNRAKVAQEKGYLKKEIVKVSIPQKKGPELVVEEDEEPKNVQLDKIPSLRPAFKKDGTITAANASTLNDGACAVVLMSAKKAKALGLTPLARIRGFADAEKAPVEFTTAPSVAVPKALQIAGISQSEVDYWEINEAFSVVALANAKELKLDPERLNIWGGGVSLGHPLGMSGARLITTLINILHEKKAKIGVAGICNGGGGASAIVLEKL